VPRLSAIQLWKWVIPSAGRVETSDQAALRALLEVDASSAKFDGYTFEYFIFRWEWLSRMSTFRHRYSSSVLGRYYRMAANSLNDALRAFNVNVEFRERGIAYLEDSIRADLATELYSLDKLYYVGKSNPGFDYFYRERSTDGSDILVLVEVKFSDVNTEDQQLLTKEVNTKMAHCARAVATLSGEHQRIEFHRIFVIFLAMRTDVTKTLLLRPLRMDGKTAIPSLADPKIPEYPCDDRIVGIVLNRDMLRTLIGDTLFYRAMFSLQP